MSRITIVYVPGLGDVNLATRRRALSLWKFRSVTPVIFGMDWSVDEPWPHKLQRLNRYIQSITQPGHSIVLIGESAGASAVTQAFVGNPGAIAGIVLLCGKFQYPELLGSSYTSRHPALKDAVTGSAAAIQELSADQKPKILSLHPVFDPIVPVRETKIHGVKNSTIPMVGHATSITFAITIWSWRIVAHAKYCAKLVQ